MKWLDFYSDKLGCNDQNQVFDYLIKTLKPSSTTWDYFVDWRKIKERVKKHERPLHLLNSLVGKPSSEFDDDFRSLVAKYPEVIEAIQLLVACRPDKFPVFQILEFDEDKCQLNYESINLRSYELVPDHDFIERCLNFVSKIGLKTLMSDGSIKNTHDYMFGVEVGLNTNARKNRGGNIMENMVEAFLKKVVVSKEGSYTPQVRYAGVIKQALGIYLPPNLARQRRYDFALKMGDKPFLIEANFYNATGSKLNATAGQFIALNKELTKQNCQFIWITDGQGWSKTQPPLYKAFDELDYIFNLDMLEKGVLAEL